MAGVSLRKYWYRFFSEYLRLHPVGSVNNPPYASIYIYRRLYKQLAASLIETTEEKSEYLTNFYEYCNEIYGFITIEQLWVICKMYALKGDLIDLLADVIFINNTQNKRVDFL